LPLGTIQVNAVLKEIVETGYTKTPEGESLRVHSSISTDEGLFLQELIRRFKPTLTLEIGLAFGVSALYICEALEKTSNARHTVIDPHQYLDPWGGNGWKGAGLYNLRQAGYGSMVDFIDLPSYQALPQLELSGQKIDFAFIDGWHTFDYSLIDFFYIDKMLRVDGIVVFDDADWPSIRKVCRYVLMNLSYEVVPQASSPTFSKWWAFSWKVDCLNRILKVGDPFLKPELIRKDKDLGLQGNIVAFRKKSEDARKWDFHREF
jgi:predicted O-methyltransferase YrrM